MSDRELLGLAAKAAGYKDAKHKNMEGWGEFRYGFSEAMWLPDREEYWNPIQDDGDALRLAVKLNLWDAIRAAHRLLGGEADMYAATRRAIVRAAAEIARAQPSVQGGE